jgi:hypothetical protein
MSALVISRRAMLEAAAFGAGVLAAGFHATTMAAAATSSAEASSSAVLAAWVVLRADAGADVQFAYLAARGRLLRVLPAIRLEAQHTATPARPASAWSQAQEAARLAQTLAAAMVARAWGAPESECAILRGRIVHLGSGRWIGHRVWLDFA